MTVVWILAVLFVGFVCGGSAAVIVYSDALRSAQADAARWQYVRQNAEIVCEVQEGVYEWCFEAVDVSPVSLDADVDASIAAYEQRQEAWL